MVVEQIAVGTKLMLGTIENTNSQYIAKQCTALGLEMCYQSVVGDVEDRIKESLLIAMQRSDCVIMTGGLGPTEDDITKEVVAKALNRKLIHDESIELKINDFYNKKGKNPAKTYKKQADIIEGATVMFNDNGTAPGMIIEEGEKIIILLPGPPSEMIPMFEGLVKTYLSKKTGCVYVTKVVKLCGISEGEVSELIEGAREKIDNPIVNIYTRPAEVHISITAKADDKKSAEKLIKPIVKELKTKLGMYIYSTDEETTLEQTVVDLLVSNNMTVATIESCTGGLLSGRLINVPGVSDVFKLGHVTYSNKAKRKTLGIKKAFLDKYTAVSEEVAREMCKGSAFFYNPDVMVSVTGYAGPEGGTAEHPVGTVFVGCNVKGNIKVKEFYFTGRREKVRQLAVGNALGFMRQCILEYLSEVTFGNGQ